MPFSDYNHVAVKEGVAAGRVSDRANARANYEISIIRAIPISFSFL